jgi:hypothetical protein
MEAVMQAHVAWMVAPLLLVVGSSVCAQPLPSGSSLPPSSASMTQAGTAVWQQWPYGDSPKRELAIGVAFCDLGVYDGGRSAGVTYTRNLADNAALEATVDVGVSRRRVYDASLNDYRTSGPAHPFGLVIGQIRMGREHTPGLKEYMTLGVARAFGHHDQAASATGRAGSIGIGLRGAVGSSVAIRFDLQALFFHAALGARASAGIVIGLD